VHQPVGGHPARAGGAVPRRPLRRADADRRRAQGARVQRPLRRPRDPGRPAAPAQRPRRRARPRHPHRRPGGGRAGVGRGLGGSPSCSRRPATRRRRPRAR
jgi:hypothetical protein